jgi:CRISPR-associated protein Cas2
MPMTVITITNAPPKLRGDLSKWMQEISTGVYVGNFNSLVREKLWQRVKDSVGNGQVTLSYTSRNELGYEFKTFRTNKMSIDYDGIPLVLLTGDTGDRNHLKHGFSSVAKLQKIKKNSQDQRHSPMQLPAYVVIDIETTGLNPEKDQIIEIAAVKIEGNEITEFQKLVKISESVSKFVIELTGITDELLSQNGQGIKEAMIEFAEFVADKPLVGYNVDFDQKFMQKTAKKYGLENFQNQFIDLLKFVKKEKMFLANYKLQTVLQAYNIFSNVTHRALEDSKLTVELAAKVKGFLNYLRKKA